VCHIGFGRQLLIVDSPPQGRFANLLLSPDGQSLLLNLQTRVGDSATGLLYTIKLDATDARQITQPSPWRRADGRERQPCQPGVVLRRALHRFLGAWPQPGAAWRDLPSLPACSGAAGLGKPVGP